LSPTAKGSLPLSLDELNMNIINKLIIVKNIFKNFSHIFFIYWLQINLFVSTALYFGLIIRRSKNLE